MRFFKKKEKEAVVIYGERWISVDDCLPPLCQKVIVWGRLRKFNVCHHAWEARRWTGCMNGFNVEEEKLWDWFGPCDYHVEDVTHWFPLPYGLISPAGKKNLKESRKSDDNNK